MRRWLRSRWNTMLERRLAKMTQGETPEEVVQGLRFLSKRPRMQLRGLIGACNVLVERGEMDAAKGVAGDICALVGSGRTGHKGTVYGLERAAHIYGRCGDAERSVAVWEMALEHERAKHGPEAVPTVAATQYLAGAVRSTGDLSRAVELQRWALRCLRHRDGSASERVLKAEEELAITLYEQHEYAEAQGLLEHVVDGLGDARPEARVPRLWLASTLNKQGDREGAAKIREATLSMSQRFYGPEDRRTLNDVDHLAVTLWASGQRERARDLMEGSLASRERVLGDDDPDTQAARKRFSALRDELG